jgi:homogentisate 1,2-dioxygenase
VRSRRTLAVAFVAALSGLVAAPAIAQNAGAAATTPTKLRPKPQDDANTVTVLVTNSRKTDLVQLQVAESGSVAWKKVLGPLKAGAHAAAVLPRQFNCRVDLHGTFADGQSMEATDVEVCAQKTINLTD